MLKSNWRGYGSVTFSVCISKSFAAWASEDREVVAVVGAAVEDEEEDGEEKGENLPRSGSEKKWRAGTAAGTIRVAIDLPLARATLTEDLAATAIVIYQFRWIFSMARRKMKDGPWPPLSTAHALDMAQKEAE